MRGAAPAGARPGAGSADDKTRRPTAVNRGPLPPPFRPGGYANRPGYDSEGKALSIRQAFWGLTPHSVAFHLRRGVGGGAQSGALAGDQDPRGGGRKGGVAGWRGARRAGHIMGGFFRSPWRQDGTCGCRARPRCPPASAKTLPRVREGRGAAPTPPTRPPPPPHTAPPPPPPAHPLAHPRPPLSWLSFMIAFWSAFAPAALITSIKARRHAGGRGGAVRGWSWLWAAGRRHGPALCPPPFPLASMPPNLSGRPQAEQSPDCGRQRRGRHGRRRGTPAHREVHGLVRPPVCRF